jgi:hypothetical protein
MKILSFDVGIKNLAYCLIDFIKDPKTESYTDFRILRWDIINLMDDRNVCQHLLRTGNKCGKIGRFQMQLKPESPKQILCKAHKDKSKLELDETILFKCSHPKCIENSKFNFLGKPEWSWCEKHLKLSKSILKDFKPSKLTNQNCSQQPIQELALKLFSKLDEHKDLIMVDEVLIENQPSLKNPNMKTISTLLYSYFVLRGITDKLLTKSLIMNIKFISPSNKLKIDKTITADKLNLATSSKETYEITKGLGQIYCLALITKEEQIFLTPHLKKDDLTDCFLQAFQYVFKPIPIKYQDMIMKIDQTKLTIKKIKSKAKKNSDKDQTKTKTKRKLKKDSNIDTDKEKS